MSRKTSPEASDSSLSEKESRVFCQKAEPLFFFCLKELNSFRDFMKI